MLYTQLAAGIRSALLASLDAGIDLKDLIIYLLIMAVIGTAMWYTKKAPAPINYFLWAVLVVVGLFLTIRFIRGL